MNVCDVAWPAPRCPFAEFSLIVRGFDDHLPDCSGLWELFTRDCVQFLGLQAAVMRFLDGQVHIRGLKVEG